MAKSVLDIVIRMIKQGNADQETKNSLIGLVNNAKSAIGVFGSLAVAGAAVNSVYQNTVKVFVDYAAQVRETSRLTGLGAQEASKLIQAADDLTISYEDLNKALWAASKQGIDVSIESLASLADEYVSLGSASEQAEFLAKKFGKGGQEMGKLMEQGASGVMSMTDAIEGNLVLTEQAIRQAREYEIMTDNLTDAWTGFKVAAGGDALPTVNKILQELTTNMEESGLAVGILRFGFDDLYRALTGNTRASQENNSNIDSATASYMAWAQQLGIVTTEVTGLSEATGQLNNENQNLISLIGSLQSETDSFNSKNEELKLKLEDLYAQREKVSEWSTKYKELTAEIGETEGAVSELAAEHEMASKRIAFSLLQQKLAVDGLTDAEFGALMGMGVQWGIFDEQVATSALAMNKDMDELAKNIQGPSGAIMLLNDKSDAMYVKSMRDYVFDVFINTHGSFPSVPSRGTASGSGAGYENNAGKDSEFASGGQLGRGWAMVGEEGFELVTPSGYVIPNEISRAILDSGLWPENQFRVGGDMAGTGVFSGGGGYTAETRRMLKRRNRSASASSVGGGAASASQQAVAAEIAPLADTTQAAVMTSASAQQQATAEAQATRDVISKGNDEVSSLLTETNQILKSQTANMQRSMIAAMQMVNP